jgi:hypothetical protein
MTSIQAVTIDVYRKRICRSEFYFIQSFYVYKKNAPKSFPDIEKLVPDFLFDHFVYQLARSLEYIVNPSLMDDHLKMKQRKFKIHVKVIADVILSHVMHVIE